MSLLGREIWTQRHSHEEEDVKRHKENLAFYEPRGKAWIRSFPHRPQKEPTLWMSWFWASNLHSCEKIKFCCLSYPAWVTGILCFSNAHSVPLQFYKRPALVPVFTNQKIIQTGFSLLQKEVKSKNSALHWFCSTQVLRRHASWAVRVVHQERGTAKLLPQELRSASQLQTAIALNCVCEHLCFISFYFVHPLVRYVLR